MKFTEAIDHLGAQESVRIAAAHAASLGMDWKGGIAVVFGVCLRDPERRPNLGTAKDFAERVIQKWVQQYVRGYANRPSACTGKLCQTVPDQIIDEILKARFELSAEQIEAIQHAHRLSMSAENMLGSFLEEYVALRLSPYGWHCAWGNTLKSVDLCHEDGRLLQIKNRSNTENSSSGKVRTGTQIQKWFRVDALDNEYLWDDLQRLTGAGDLSEEGFRAFVLQSIDKNPHVFPAHPQSPWKKKTS